MLDKRIFKLLNNEIVLGEIEVVQTENGAEVLIKKPFTVQDSKIIPYCARQLGSSPAAIQIHPMNIIWQNKLEDFPHLATQHTEITSGLITGQPKTAESQISFNYF